MASRGGVTDEKVSEIRAVVGSGPSDMDIIRALYQSKNDVSSALNIIFDTPSWVGKLHSPKKKRKSAHEEGQRMRVCEEKNVVTKVVEGSTQVDTVPFVQEVDGASTHGQTKPVEPVIMGPSAQGHSRPSGTEVIKTVDVPARRAVSSTSNVSSSEVNPYRNLYLSPNPEPSTGEIDSTEVILQHVKSVASVENLDRKETHLSNNQQSVICEDNFSPPTSQADMSLVHNQSYATDSGEDRGHHSLPNNSLTVGTQFTVDLKCTSFSPLTDLTCTELTTQNTLATPMLTGGVSPIHTTTNLLQNSKIAQVQGDGRSFSLGFLNRSDSLRTRSLLLLETLWQQELVFLGQCEVICLSTCRGAKLGIGDELDFVFPKHSGADSRPPQDSKRGWGRAPKAAADIVRFSTKKSGEIGRLPGDWARSLIPLVSSRKVAVSAICTNAPACLGLLDSISLLLGIFVTSSVFKKYDGSPANSISVSADQSTHNPLLSVLRLLQKRPFKKAEFTPEDLYNRKRSLDLDTTKKFPAAGSPEPILPPEKRLKLSGPSSASVEAAEGEELSDADLNKIVGSSDGCELMEMDAPLNLECDLRPYQKQALYWMSKMESGRNTEDAAKTLHPCWEAYYLGDETSVFYVNVFSGDATLDFPSALQTSRGGILADAMGLGKTVMTIAMLVASPGKGGMRHINLDVPSSDSKEKKDQGVGDLSSPHLPTSGQPLPLKLGSKTPTGKMRGGGTLIICPMTLLGQWKTELESHVKPGIFSVHSYYGQDRSKETRSLLEYDIVLTTYGVLSSDCSSQTSPGNDVLQSIHWFRVVLDEAHTIKGLRTQASQAAFKLTADCRWCLTGTPIQNKLEDAFSLLHFLRIEPWGNFGWWTKLIQKPFDEGDERGLKLLQAVLKPLMLRRTKDTLDKLGRPILVLPPVDLQVIQCELSEAERDFYEALFKKSKVKFDMFVEQGKVLHNYASILELLLRLRQCCDHPYLVMSRGDTDEFSDLNKLAKHFMDGSTAGAGTGPTRAFVETVVNDIRNGEKAECPICLEAAEDAVLTPCAHCVCRECLFASWRQYTGGPCPICRQHVSRQDVITAPKESRFHIDVDKNWRDSSKVSALLQQLETIRLAGDKSIIFSQWTSFLDLLQIPLKRRKFQFVRLDGTLSQAQREEVIKDFSNNSKILVMLISLKAGGVGINLTAASHAFLLDPWWNPAVEEQAIMRIHRIGQTKNVSVKRFICKGTVEERMQQVQARKQRIISGALNNQEVRSARIEELKMLFR